MIILFISRELFSLIPIDFLGSVIFPGSALVSNIENDRSRKLAHAEYCIIRRITVLYAVIHAEYHIYKQNSYSYLPCFPIHITLKFPTKKVKIIVFSILFSTAISRGDSFNGGWYDNDWQGRGVARKIFRGAEVW